MHHTMCAMLVRLYFACQKKRWVHSSEVLIEGQASAGDLAKFRFWQLVEQKPKGEGDENKRTSGFWAITEKGRMFVRNEIELFKYVLIYNNELEGFAEPLVKISDIYRNYFDYPELMQSKAPGGSQQSLF